MTNGLDDQTIIVTGAASGIGRTMVRYLLKAGARVGAVDVDPSPLDQESEARLHSAIADISNREQVAEAIRDIEAALGPVGGLVNNAGIVTNIAPFEKMSGAAWDHEMAVNLTGAFNLIQAVIPGMRERRYGRIVNVSSLAARGGLMHQAGYAASKAALLGLTRTITLEYARHGITCNSVLPGLIATGKVLAMPEAIKDEARSMTPARRFGEEAEIAALVAFLLSPGSGFINGADIDVSGGAHLNLLQLGSRRELSPRDRAG